MYISYLLCMTYSWNNYRQIHDLGPLLN